QWYQKAADPGYARAIFNLGPLYEQGQGVEKDGLKALNLYRQAWGVPEDNIIFTSAANEQQEALRAELNAAVAEKESQMQLLQKQLQNLQNKLARQPDPVQTANNSKEVDALK